VLFACGGGAGDVGISSDRGGRYNSPELKSFTLQQKWQYRDLWIVERGYGQ
jgi:hypothetical protein